MDPTLLMLAIALTVAVSAIIQGSVGFGFALFTMPVLLILGLPPKVAVFTSGTCSFILTSYVAWKVRRHVAWRELAPYFIAGWLGVPFGLFLLHRVALLHPDTIKQIFGGLVLLAVIVQQLAKIQPQARVGWGWGAGALFGSGMMSGLSGVGGPPVVLWVMAHDWSGQRLRGTMQTIFPAIMVVQLTVMAGTFPTEAREGAMTALVAIPGALVGATVGVWIGDRTSRRTLRALATALLLLIALSALFTPWLPWSVAEAG